MQHDLIVVNMVFSFDDDDDDDDVIIDLCNVLCEDLHWSALADETNNVVFVNFVALQVDFFFFKKTFHH